MGDSKKQKSGLATSFGVVIKDLRGQERRALNELLFAVTDPAQHNILPESVLQDPNRGSPPRELPNHDIKKDHLFIRGISLTKNLQKGTWEISLIETNQGKFQVGPEQNDQIDSKEISLLVDSLRSIFEGDLQVFLKNEKSE
jgi:hypothetical protein